MTDDRSTSTPSMSNLMTDFFKGAAIAAATIGGAYLLTKGVQGLFAPPRRKRRLLSTRSSVRTVYLDLDDYNREPLPVWKREAVLQRDGFTCVYCGASANHVDHRRSRRNGGTNHMNNLSAACADCNWRKGGMNAREFRRRLTR